MLLWMSNDNVIGKFASEAKACGPHDGGSVFRKDGVLGRPPMLGARIGHKHSTTPKEPSKYSYIELIMDANAVGSFTSSLAALRWRLGGLKKTHVVLVTKLAR